MVQCKNPDCKEEAQKNKRLCSKHEAAKEARRRAARFKRLQQPKCVYCGTQHTTDKGLLGEPECHSCANLRAGRDQAKAEEQDRLNSLEQCKTVEELKTFIRFFILD